MMSTESMHVTVTRSLKLMGLRGVKLVVLALSVLALEVVLLPRELRLGPSERDALQARPMFARSTASIADDGSTEAAKVSPEVNAALLTDEQRAVAGFIAHKYRLDVETVESVVRVAYLAAQPVNIDPLLVLAIISVESAFNPTAQSRRGAQGLMQVRTRVHAERFEPFGGRLAAFDPWANIHVGISILKDYLTREGTVERALKSYVGAAQRPDDGGYGAKVLGERARLSAVARGEEPLAATTRGEHPFAGSSAAGGTRSLGG
jgi:soluble lytic murein transglycosylase-like protein